MADKLTVKQEKFVQGLFAGLSQRDAYKAAYDTAKMKDKTVDEKACLLAKKDKIRARLEELTNELKERNMISVEYVLSTIHETVERCKQSYPVLDRRGKQVFVETPDGEMLPAYEFDAKDVLKGCELLGKHLGMFIDKKEITGPNGGPIQTQTQNMTDDELDAQITQLMGQVKLDEGST